MADGSVQPEWRYVFKKSDPASARDAYVDLLQDEEDPLTLIDIDDDCFCTFSGAVLYIGDREVANSCSGEIHIDYGNFRFTLPDGLKEAYELETSEVLAKNVRYVGLPRSGSNAEDNSGTLAHLSLWNKERNIRSIFISFSDSKQCVLFLNAMSRLIYEAFGRSTARTHKFFSICEGPVDVAWCTADERDARDAWKQSQDAEKEKSTGGKSTLEADAADDNDGKKERKEYSEPKRSPMYFTIDEEAILLFQHTFSYSPLHDFRFYREVTTRSIDTIYVCNTEDQLEIQQGDSVFFILPQRDSQRSSACFKELVDILRDGTVKPKTEKAFGESGEAYSKIFKADDKFSDDLDLMSVMPSSALRQSGRSTARPQDSKAYGQNPSWLSNLNSGEHLLTVDEDMQVMWFVVQPALEQIVNAGAIPESDMNSSGLNPDSLEHLQTAVESIRDKLLSESYDEALSHMRGILKVFGKSLLAKLVADRVDEIELLKRIYFLI